MSGCTGQIERGAISDLERSGYELAMELSRRRKGLRIETAGPLMPCTACGQRRAAIHPVDLFCQSAKPKSFDGLARWRSAGAGSVPSGSIGGLDQSDGKDQGQQNEGEQKGRRCIPEFVRPLRARLIEKLIYDARHHLFTP